MFWFGLGVGGSVLRWFTSYLKERYQSIKIGCTLSDACKLVFGVSQGSVLGPLLSLYTTPLSVIISRHQGIGFHFYADDTQLYVQLTHKNASVAFDKMNRCLLDAKNWMSSNKLKLNPDKTEFIVFGSTRLRELLKSHLPVDILGNLLQPADFLSEIWVCGLTLISPCLSMCKVSVKAVLHSSRISGVSEGTIPPMLLLWLPML